MEAPTIERLRQSEAWEAPEITQTVKRVAYRALGAFERMERAGRITEPQFRAGSKFERHYLGSLGVNVGTGDGFHDLEQEEARTYHAKMVSVARSVLLEPEFQAVVHHVEGTAELDGIGRMWRGPRVNRAQAYAFGTALTVMALERLALLWRLKEP